MNRARDGRGDELAPLPRELVEGVTGVDGLDVALEETPFFRLVARAQRDLRLLRTSRSEPWLLWIKSRGVPTPWLAPREFATRYLDISPDADPDELPEEDDADDGDDSLVQLSAADFDALLKSAAALPVGRQRRDAMTDAERLLSRKVLGGYVSMLDAGLGRLMEHVEPAAAASPTLLIVTAARGIAVREPGLLRDAAEPLAEETLHAPLFVRGCPEPRHAAPGFWSNRSICTPRSPNGSPSTRPRSAARGRACSRFCVVRDRNCGDSLFPQPIEISPGFARPITTS